jgi:hypothetical protein
VTFTKGTAKAACLSRLRQFFSFLSDTYLIDRGGTEGQRPSDASPLYWRGIAGLKGEVPIEGCLFIRAITS